MILPKLWLAKIPKYWNKTIPTNIPKSSSEFSFKFDTEDQKDAVVEMEKNLNTEESIIKPDDIEENQILSNYLGTYNVNGTPGELTLLNPNKIGNKDLNVIAYHYTGNIDSETETENESEDESTINSDNGWEKIEDAQIIDGYVWGTVNSFSPIAVFTTVADSYFLQTIPGFKNPGYIGNGVPIVVSLNDKGKTIVTDANGKVTEIPATTIIVGGSLDRDIESTSVIIKGNVKLAGIRAGSWLDGSSEKPLKVGKVYCKIDGLNRPSAGVTGSYGAVRTDEVEIIIKDSKLSFCGAGESICKTDANKDDATNCSLHSKAWIKKSNITLINSFVECAYAGGNCGYMYNNDATLNVTEGSETKWTICGGSNGATGTGRIIGSDSKLEIVQSTNRGPVKYAEEKLTNCEVDYLFPTGDSTDSTVNGTIEKVKVDVSNGTINLYPGTNGGTIITAEDAKEIVETIKISRTTNIEYKESSDKIFKDIIRLK